MPTSLNRPLSITMLPLADIHLDPKNARVHTKTQINQISRSIKTFGFNVPALIDAKRKVIAGHGRILACRQLGFTEVPTICLEHLTAAQAQAFMIADNRLTENSSWDERLLGEQLKALSVINLDFSIEATGFEMGEIDLLIEKLDLSADASADAADEIPDLPAEPTTRPGDLWTLGPHRVFCGNSLEEASYGRLMGDKRGAMVFTDIPFNLPILGLVSGLGKVKHKNFAMASGEMNPEEFTQFLAAAFTLLARYTEAGSIHFLCADWRHIQEFHAAAKSVYTEFKNLAVWVKDNGGMGSFYRSQHELIFVWKNGKSPHRNNIQLGRFGRNRTNVWKYPGVTSLRAGEEGNLLALHPTVKPVALVADAILDCSARGDLVLDAFLGSGTTVMAAERVGRICYGIEIDPKYVDVAIRRWQKFSGERARHAVTGRYFDDGLCGGGA
jgi:DNA modification methylase